MKRLMNLESFLAATPCEVKSRHLTAFSGVGTDTRKDLTNQLFIALRGEAYDAHQFLQKAVDQKVAALVIDRETPETSRLASLVTVIRVPDTLVALQNFATFHRKAVRPSVKVVGITGSNGKTSSKEFAATVLKEKRKVHYSQGSFNNHWGVPFTLLGIEEDHEVVLVEMGMNHAGELTQLMQVAQPHVVVVTMVGRAHIEHFGSVEQIAKAKEEVYEAASSQAIRIYNLDSPLTFAMYQKSLTRFRGARTVTFSTQNERADIVMQPLEVGMNELKVHANIQGQQRSLCIPVFGLQNITNLMVAAAIGLSCDLLPEDLFRGLEKCQNVWGRSQWIDLESQARLLFDGYNANPDSMAALLENVKGMQGARRKIAVLAEMLEMGEKASEFHYELGARAAQSNLDYIWFYGPHAADFERGLQAQNFKNSYSVSNSYEEVLADKTASMLQAGDVVIVKGSRGMRAEKFVDVCRPLAFCTAKA